MESSSVIPKLQDKVPVPKSPAFELCIAAVNAAIGEECEAFLCGGTVRDMLNLKTPNDIDIAVSPRAFSNLKSGLRKHLEVENNKWKLEYTVDSEKTIALSVGVAKGSHLYRVKLLIKESIDRGSTTIELDFREMKFPDLESLSESEPHLLRVDVLTRDFKVNSMYCSTRDYLLIDYSSGNLRSAGFRDLEDRLLETVLAPAQAFVDPRRLIRAVRLQAQHNYSLSKRVADYLALRGHADIRSSKEKGQFASEYEKVLSDDKNFAVIMSNLAKHGLILNCEKVAVSSELIAQLAAILKDRSSESKDGKLERLLDITKNLPNALASCFVLISSSKKAVGGSIVFSIEVDLYKIMRNLVRKPKNSSPNIRTAFGVREFAVDICQVIVWEIKLLHPIMVKVLSKLQCPISPSSISANQESIKMDLQAIYTSLLEPMDEAKSSKQTSYLNVMSKNIVASRLQSLNANDSQADSDTENNDPILSDSVVTPSRFSPTAPTTSNKFATSPTVDCLLTQIQKTQSFEVKILSSPVHTLSLIDQSTIEVKPDLPSLNWNLPELVSINPFSEADDSFQPQHPDAKPPKPQEPTITMETIIANPHIIKRELSPEKLELLLLSLQTFQLLNLTGEYNKIKTNSLYAIIKLVKGKLLTPSAKTSKLAAGYCVDAAKRHSLGVLAGLDHPAAFKKYRRERGFK